MNNKSYCDDCPDKEVCHQGASCEFVKAASTYFETLNATLSGKGPIMSNTSKTTVTPADVAKGKNNKPEGESVEQLLNEAEALQGEKIPSQAQSSENNDSGETDAPKKKLKERLAPLTAELKRHRKFLAGFVTGVVATSLVAVMTAAKAEKMDVEAKEEFDSALAEAEELSDHA